MNEISVNNDKINTEIIKIGRPKLTEEEKILQKQKRKEYQRKYRIDNKEQLKEKRVEYINKNIDKIKLTEKNHYINNKEKYIENAKKHRLKIKEQLKEKDHIIEQLKELLNNTL